MWEAARISLVWLERGWGMGGDDAGETVVGPVMKGFVC